MLAKKFYFLLLLWSCSSFFTLGNFLANAANKKVDLSGYKRISPDEPIAIWKSLDGIMDPSIVPSAMEAIKAMVGDHAINCISVVGEYHSGKSSFNNAILNEDLFLVASDIPPQTQGFEVAVLKHTSDEEKPVVILVDTPGSGAADFLVDEQAALFGAAYLMSSTLVFNSIRQVGTTVSLEWLADRLRYVKSTEPMIPEIAAFSKETDDLDLHWVINNVDLKDPQASSDEQLKLFIHEHSRRRFELNTIFPNDIHPFTLPTPGSPELLQYMRSNETLWSDEYRIGIHNFRKKVFDIPGDSQRGDKRIFNSFAQWESIVSFAFSEPTSKVLRGLAFEADSAAKKITETLLVEKALDAAKEKFHVESESTIDVIPRYAKFLDGLLNECVDYSYSRAIAVDKNDMEATVRNSLVPSLKSSIAGRIREMEARLEKNVTDARMQVEHGYDDVLERDFPIPYDPTSYDTSAQRGEAKALLISLMGQIRDDKKLVFNAEKTLTSSMKDKEKHHEDSNNRKIDHLASRYGEEVHKAFESIANVVSNNWNTAAQPDADMIENGKKELEKSRYYFFSDQGYLEKGFSPWISRTKAMKQEINQAQIKIKGLIAKLEENQNQRVYNYGLVFKEKVKHDFEGSLLSEMNLPTTRADIDLQMTRMKNLMIDHFRRELGALKKYKSVWALEVELNDFAESRREEQHMHNEDEWKRLVNDPIKLAKTAYLRHISDHCAALSINQWIFDYSCAKIDSWTGFFNSRMGKARDLIYEKIDTAIKNEKVADHDHIQKSKAKYGRISDISRTMMKKITADAIREWTYDSRLLSTSTFWLSYLIFGWTSLAGVIIGAILTVAMPPVGILMILFSTVNFLFLYY